MEIMDEKRPFSEALRVTRKEAGLTQQALSDKARIPRRTIEEWEAGRRIPPEYVQYLVLDWIQGRK